MAIVTLALLALQAAPGPATPPRPIEPGGWIGMGDYPAPALRSETSGAVEVRLAVDGQGRVTGCEITRSAGRVLDEATCRLLRERARFQPGRDSTGAPVRSTHRTRIEWQLPGVETPVPVPFAPSRVLVTTFTPNRGTPYCRIETHGQPPGPILLTGCAPRTIPDQPPQVPGGYMWATTMLLPDGQEPAFEASPPGRIIVRTRVRFEVDRTGVVTRCRMAGPDAAPASRSVATNHCAALLAGGMPTFHLAEPGSLPRRGEFRSYVSVGRAAGTTGRR